MTFQSVVQGLSPTALWMLDEASGSTAADSSGNSHNGAYVSSPSLGQTSILHDGSGATSMRTAEGVNGNMSVTSAAWMDNAHGSAVIRTKITSGLDGTNGDAVFSRYNAGVYPWLLWRDFTGHWCCQINATTNCADPTVSTTGNEYTVGFTYDGTNIRLYVDGVKVNTVAYSSSMATGTAPIEVGRYSSATANIPAGSFSGAGFWAGTVLSDADMTAIHAAVTAVTATASLTLSGSASAKAPATATASLTLSGSATAVPTSSTATASLSLSASATARATASATAHIDLQSTGEAAILYLPDTSNALLGLDMVMTGTSTQSVPVVAPPPSMTLATKVDKAVAYPTPVMVDGRPT